MRRLVNVELPEPEPKIVAKGLEDDEILAMHGGAWARPEHGEGLVCRLHGLRPDEH